MSNCYNIVKIKTEKPHITDQGFLRCLVSATRTGVFPYVDSTGKIRRELRLPEEVFKKESMESLANIPFTDDHPCEAVTSENAIKYTRGLTGSRVWQNNDLLETELLAFDSNTINKISNGKIEVSLGYNADKEFASGIYNGQPYDCIQRNIRYNHLALVPSGRANINDHLRRVKLNLDHDTDVSVEIEDQNQILNNDSQTEKDSTFMKLNLDGMELEFADASTAIAIKNKLIQDALKIEEEKKLNSELKKQLDTITAQKDSLAVNLDSATREIEQLKSAPKLDNKAIQNLASELIEVREFVKTNAPKLTIDGLSSDEIKKIFVSEKLGNESIKDKSNDYINAAFDTFKQINIVSNVDNDAKFVSKVKNTDGEKLSAREIYMKNIQNRNK
ncbi:DUF2213 domain-containing protein [Fluviispira vulneris]|uniref:DUF2213 domain-containing protein n=1 Tax=Fluviispira vulneris TaxID=2763012 RepID=UPI001645278B|nr:DUF2213 domain-containing protein [Fluviispira vulneris]